MLIVLAIILTIAFASYKLLNIAEPTKNDSKLIQSHSKIIQAATTPSSGDSNSNSDSSPSRSSRDSNKPIGIAATVRKDVISSNYNGGDGDGEDPS